MIFEFHIFQPCHNVMAGVGCNLSITALVVSAIFLTTDALLLLGTLKQNKIVLIVGLVLNVIVTICTLVLLIWLIIASYWLIPCVAFIAIAFRVWPFLTVVGILQELTMKENTMAMTDLPFQGLSD